MKNQYFGDEHDFKKYMMLRSFIKEDANIELLIAWYLTKDDEKNDGNKRTYLSNEKKEKFKSADKELFDWLQTMSEQEIKVDLEEYDLPVLCSHTKYYGEPIDTHVKNERNKWFQGLMQESKSADIVFLDPDNGIRYNNNNSNKHVYFDEIIKLWDNDKSLIIYQHAPYVNREVFIYGTMTKLSHELGGSPFIATVYSPHVMYFFVLKKEHKVYFTEMKENYKQWKGLLSIFDFEIGS